MIFEQFWVGAEFEHEFQSSRFYFALAISFSDRTLQLRSLSGVICGEQDLLKTKCTKEKCTPQQREMYIYECTECNSPYCRVHFSLLHLVFKGSCSPNIKLDRDGNWRVLSEKLMAKAKWNRLYWKSYSKNDRVLLNGRFSIKATYCNLSNSNYSFLLAFFWLERFGQWILGI